MKREDAKDFILEHLYGELDPERERAFLAEVDEDDELEHELTVTRKLLTAYRMAPPPAAPKNAAQTALETARNERTKAMPLFPETPAEAPAPATEPARGGILFHPALKAAAAVLIVGTAYVVYQGIPDAKHVVFEHERAKRRQAMAEQRHKEEREAPEARPPEAVEEELDRIEELKREGELWIPEQEVKTDQSREPAPEPREPAPEPREPATEPGADKDDTPPGKLAQRSAATTEAFGEAGEKPAPAAPGIGGRTWRRKTPAATTEPEKDPEEPPSAAGRIARDTTDSAPGGRGRTANAEDAAPMTEGSPPASSKKLENAPTAHRRDEGEKDVEGGVADNAHTTESDELKQPAPREAEETVREAADKRKGNVALVPKAENEEPTEDTLPPAMEEGPALGATVEARDEAEPHKKKADENLIREQPAEAALRAYRRHIQNARDAKERAAEAEAPSGPPGTRDETDESPAPKTKAEEAPAPERPHDRPDRLRWSKRTPDAGGNAEQGPADEAEDAEPPARRKSSDSVARTRGEETEETAEPQKAALAEKKMEQRRAEARTRNTDSLEKARKESAEAMERIAQDIAEQEKRVAESVARGFVLNARRRFELHDYLSTLFYIEKALEKKPEKPELLREAYELKARSELALQRLDAMKESLAKLQDYDEPLAGELQRRYADARERDREAAAEASLVEEATPPAAREEPRPFNPTTDPYEREAERGF